MSFIIELREMISLDAHSKIQDKVNDFSHSPPQSNTAFPAPAQCIKFKLFCSSAKGHSNIIYYFPSEYPIQNKSDLLGKCFENLASKHIICFLELPSKDSAANFTPLYPSSLQKRQVGGKELNGLQSMNKNVLKMEENSLLPFCCKAPCVALQKRDKITNLKISS